MNRFYTLNEEGTHLYTAEDIAEMTDCELADEIRSAPVWDGDLLADLIWRAFPDFDEEWEAGDETCFRAAETLGVEII